LQKKTFQPPVNLQILIQVNKNCLALVTQWSRLPVMGYSACWAWPTGSLQLTV